MARYTPEFLAALKRRYEDTDQSMRSIAAELGISLRTLHRLVEREGWRKRADRPPHDLPPAVRLFEQAHALTAAQASPAPTRSPAPPLSATGIASIIDRIEALVLKEVKCERIARAHLLTLEQTSEAAQRSARTLSIHSETLRKLQWLRAGQAAAAGRISDDDRIEDVDAFRTELARRIDAFVASRAGDDD
jgi:transposase-like protein